MTEAHSKKISELPTVNSVSNSDILLVLANVSGNVATSQISVNNFVQSSVGNQVGQSVYTVTNSSNTVKVATDSTPVSYFTYDRTVYAGVTLLVDMIDTSNNRTFGEVRVAANSTVANAISSSIAVGATPINIAANASISGNTVSLSFSQTGSTANVQVRYLATYFRV